MSSPSPATGEGTKDTPPAALLHVILLLLLASSVSWRKGTYFSGGLDPVVAAKALLAALALVLSWYAARRARSWHRLGARTVSFAVLYLAATCLGGWANGDTQASVIVAVRVGIIVVAMLFVLTAYPPRQCITALTRVMLGVAGIAAVTGLPSLAATGRLSGGIPPLSANELSMLISVPFLVRLQKVVLDRASSADWVVLAVSLGVIWVTGSRTGIAMLAVAAMVMLVQARTFKPLLFLGLVVSVPLLAFVVLETGAVQAVFARGGSQNVATLSSRTIAWTSALDYNRGDWQRWFGNGLSMKQIPVAGQYWNVQILDSSWVSALVQGGLVGVAAVALWVVVTVVASARSEGQWRALWLGLLVFVVGRSILESGLFDATSALLTFLLVSALTEPVNRPELARDVAEASPSLVKQAKAAQPIPHGAARF